MFNTFSKFFIIFSLKIKFIESFIDFFSVSLLDNLQEWLNKLNNVQSSKNIGTFDQIYFVSKSLE